MQHDKEQLLIMMIEKISGTISEEDASRLDEAVSSSAEVAELWETVRNGQNKSRLHAFGGRLDSDGAWHKVQTILAQKKDGAPRHTQTFRFAKIAASLLVLTIMGYSLWFLSGRQSNERALGVAPDNHQDSAQVYIRLASGKQLDISATHPDSIDLSYAHQLLAGQAANSGNGTSALHELHVPVAEDYLVVLRDGTRVRLNSSSSLKFPLTFAGHTREVYLNGEAYFDVVSDSERPFIVHANAVDVHVTGTSFNIKSYESGGMVATSLIAGAITASVNNQRVLLEPGNALILDEDGMSVRPFEKEEVISWIDGVYVFGNERLSEIAAVLQRWYGVKVVIEDETIGNRRLSGKIEKAKPLGAFLSNLALSGTVKFTETSPGVLHFY